ncbi:hypothetical protein ISS03_02775 [Patescibacteria group bacterium]|nr:hypothetical protein [Patescibacteria group bacterium]
MSQPSKTTIQVSEHRHIDIEEMPDGKLRMGCATNQAQSIVLSKDEFKLLRELINDSALDHFDNANPDLNPIHATLIENMNFSTRVKGRLTEDGINTISDLISLSSSELFKTPGIGFGSVREIVSVLDEMFLSLRGFDSKTRAWLLRN